MNRAMAESRSISWKLWAGIFISALFLYLAFRKVNLGMTWAVIRGADIPILGLMVIVTFFQFVVRALRWHVLLYPIKATGFTNRLLSVLTGFAANCILPARLGEFVRANCLSRREDISGSSVFATIVVERIFDGFTLLFILLIGLMGTTFPMELQALSGKLRFTGIILFLLYIMIIVFLMGFKYRTETFLNLLKRLLFFLPHDFRSRVIGIVRNFSLGLVPIKGISGWIQAISYSLLLWFLGLLQILLVEHSIGLSLPSMAPFLIFSISTFGVMIPSAPGFIGTFHLATQYGFMFFGVAKEEALSAAILWHATFFFPTLLFGFISLLFLQVSYRDLSEESHIQEVR